jgi:serine/threonine-protein kinase RsbW
MEEVYSAETIINFSSKVENISLVEHMIDKVCAEYNINEDYYGNILIALTEAVNNAIIHGNKNNPDKMVCVKFENRDSDLLFTVEDQGNGFDYNNLPDPTDPNHIENPNGRGVFLMKNLADEVDFFENGKKVSLKFRISGN